MSGLEMVGFLNLLGREEGRGEKRKVDWRRGRGLCERLMDDAIGESKLEVAIGDILEEVGKEKWYKDKVVFYFIYFSLFIKLVVIIHNRVHENTR